MVRRAIAGGHDVAAICRNPPPAGAPARLAGAEYFSADVTTGEGLAAALAGADVVIDCLEGRSGKALKGFADGGARLLAAAQDAGVAQGRDAVDHQLRPEQLRLLRLEGGQGTGLRAVRMETVALRATQFHSLLATMFGAGSKLRIIPVVKGARFQPIAPSDVAAALLGAALEPSVGLRHSVRTIGGPEIHGMDEFARQWKAVNGSRGRLVQFPLPGAMGSYLRAGLNLVPEQRHAGETFSGWLAKNADSL